ncbi:hypothetical protein TYRP_021728 [Tyrophagus putrescentiae]|nr:hypothetical protein TYRP_021728 [Tyrophagus putrescentiae]
MIKNQPPVNEEAHGQRQAVHDVHLRPKVFRKNEVNEKAWQERGLLLFSQVNVHTICAPFSPIISTAASVPLFGISGIIEPSITLSPLTPFTLRRGSSTASSRPGPPTRSEPTK